MSKTWEHAETQNRKTIVNLLGERIENILDLGCGDGSLTAEIKKATGAKEAFGVDILDANLQATSDKGIRVVKADLNSCLPFEDSSFEAIVANQVIEHLYDVDTFLNETYRILRKKGVFVVSTENLASWHNIGALLFGWLPFSMTNISQRMAGVGNPLALHRGENPVDVHYGHLRIFTLVGLTELLECQGFTVKSRVGAGYFPFPPTAGDILARLDPRHASFITIKSTK